jgi:hypothetical protein
MPMVGAVSLHGEGMVLVSMEDTCWRPKLLIAVEQAMIFFLKRMTHSSYSLAIT